LGGAGANAARRLPFGTCERYRGAAGADGSVFIAPLHSAFADLRNFLSATPVTEETIPSALVRDWVSADGKARVQILPKGDPNDTDVLREFARAVQNVAPNASGGPIRNVEASRTVVTAFIQAGVIAIVLITLLLWITLRRFGDVMLTLVPLLLAATVTLEIWGVHHRAGKVPWVHNNLSQSHAAGTEHTRFSRFARNDNAGRCADIVSAAALMSRLWALTLRC
jgi:hypothetical protein